MDDAAALHLFMRGVDCRIPLLASRPEINEQAPFLRQNRDFSKTFIADPRARANPKGIVVPAALVLSWFTWSGPQKCQGPARSIKPVS